jgi:hypothetical protein
MRQWLAGLPIVGHRFEKAVNNIFDLNIVSLQILWFGGMPNATA